MDVASSAIVQVETNYLKLYSLQIRLQAINEELNQHYHAYPGDRPEMCTPQVIVDTIGDCLRTLDHEELWVVYLDTRNKIMQTSQIYRGTINSTNIRLAELFKPAIILSSASIILVHNHPSGDTSTSPEDIKFTEAAIAAGKLLDIEVLDHIIIGTDKFISLKASKACF